MTATTYDAWPIATPPGVELGTSDEALIASAQWFAQGTLWAKMGRRHGLARTTGEQYRAHGSDRCGETPWHPVLYDGEWYNCRGPHRCCMIQLEHQPVRAVSEVRLNGAAVSGWTLEGNMIHRDDACWPTGHDAVIEVDYTWGAALPTGVDLAMGELTGEVLAGLRGDPCRLPASMLATIVRQGVTYDFGDPSIFRAQGLVGLDICDEIIDQVNPSRLKYRSRVFSPDLGRRIG